MYTLNDHKRREKPEKIIEDLAIVWKSCIIIIVRVRVLFFHYFVLHHLLIFLSVYLHPLLIYSV